MITLVASPGNLRLTQNGYSLVPIEVGANVEIISSAGNTITRYEIPIHEIPIPDSNKKYLEAIRYLVKNLNPADIIRGTLTKKDIQVINKIPFITYTVTTNGGEEITWNFKGPDSKYFFIPKDVTGMGGSRRRLRKTKKRRTGRKSTGRKGTGRKH